MSCHWAVHVHTSFGDCDQINYKVTLVNEKWNSVRRFLARLLSSWVQALYDYYYLYGPDHEHNDLSFKLLFVWNNGHLCQQHTWFWCDLLDAV